MPYPNEHAARIRDPGSFEPNSFRSKDLNNGIRIIVAKLKGGTAMIVQAYRFSVDKFTVEQAKSWLEDHKVNYIKFEPAQTESGIGGSMDNELKHVGVMGMRWGVRSGNTPQTGGRQDKKWAKNVTNKNRTKVDVYNAAAYRMNVTEIKRINSKSEYKGKNLLKDKQLQKKYMKEYTDTFTKVLNEEASKKYGTSPSGTRKVRAGFNDNGLPIFQIDEVEA